MQVSAGETAVRLRAKGLIRITNAASGEVLEATDLGVLADDEGLGQRNRRYRAPVRARRGATPRHSRVEYADPFVDGRPRTVTIAVDGRPRITGVLQ